MMQIVADGFSRKRKIFISVVPGPRIRSGLDRFMALASMEYGWYNYNKSQDIRCGEEILTKNSFKISKMMG